MRASVYSALVLSILLLATIPALGAEETEMASTYFREGGFYLRLEYPKEVSPGEAITPVLTLGTERELSFLVKVCEFYGGIFTEWRTVFDGVLSPDEKISIKYDVHVPEDVKTGHLMFLIVVYFYDFYTDYEVVWGEEHDADFWWFVAGPYIKGSDLRELEQRYEQLTDRYASLEANYSSLKGEYDKLKADYEELGEKYGRLSANYTSLSASHEKLSKRYEELSKRYDELLSEHSDLKSMYEALKEEHEALEASYDSLKSEHEDLKLELVRKEIEIKNLSTWLYVALAVLVILIAISVVIAVRRRGAR